MKGGTDGGGKGTFGDVYRKYLRFHGQGSPFDEGGRVKKWQNKMDALFVNGGCTRYGYTREVINTLSDPIMIPSQVLPGDVPKIIQLNFQEGQHSDVVD
eukprot:9491823-Pyramimonas_sp.AAC.2